MNYPLKDLGEFTEYHGIQFGVKFRCPNCGLYGSVMFDDPELRKNFPKRPAWKRAGDSLENLTLTPSVRMIGHFHSWIRNGQLCVDSAFECKKAAA